MADKIKELECKLNNMSKSDVIVEYIKEYNSEPPKSYTKKKMIEDIISMHNYLVRSEAIRNYRGK